MSIEQASVVDVVGIENSTGLVILTILDPLEWKENEHLLMIQEKLNTYLSFVESNEVLETYPDAKSRGILIRLICQYAPDDTGIHFLNQVSTIIEDANMKFEYQIKE